MTGTSWLWRAWRGRSVTFAALFASGILGLSVLSSFRHLLSRWGAPWFFWLLAPFLVLAILSRKEQEWLPDPELRTRCARWLVLGSVAIVLISTWLSPKRPDPQRAPATGEPIGRAQVQRR
ncbi:MAG: hypothetical protein ABIV50_09770 [Opitutus sp.]